MYFVAHILLYFSRAIVSYLQFFECRAMSKHTQLGYYVYYQSHSGQYNNT